MGLEGAPPANPEPWTITATGKTLRAVLDAIVAADSRYDWREDDGVVVFRPAASWLAFDGVLDNVIEPLKLQDVQVVDALNVVIELFGTSGKVGQGTGDSKHFSVDLPAGSLLAGLNGISPVFGEVLGLRRRQSGLRRAVAARPADVSLERPFAREVSRNG